jgi:hypothetical protein
MCHQTLLQPRRDTFAMETINYTNSKENRLKAFKVAKVSISVKIKLDKIWRLSKKFATIFRRRGSTA